MMTPYVDEYDVILCLVAACRWTPPVAEETRPRAPVSDPTYNIRTLGLHFTLLNVISTEILNCSDDVIIYCIDLLVCEFS